MFPMTEDEIKRETRLLALEILAVNLLATDVLLTPKSDPSALAAKIRERMIAAAGKPFPEVDDPAMSDLLSAELEAAVDRLMEMATDQINLVLEALAEKAKRGS